MPYIDYSNLLRYAFVVLIVATALVIMLLLDPWLGMNKTPFLLFFGAVTVSAWYGGLQAGLLATFLSVILSDYFFLSQQYALNVDLSNAVKISLFAVQGLLVSILCEALKHAKRKAEINLQKLKVSEERFRVALSNSDIVVFQQDQDLRYQWVHNLQGINTAELVLGKTDNELFPSSVAQQLTAIKQRAIEQGISSREEVCVTLGGADLYYDLLVEPLKDIDGGVTCVGVNITERKQTEIEKAKLQKQLQQNVQEKNETLALLNAWLSSSPMALAFLDTELRYVYANEALAAINGIPRHQHIGRTLKEVLPQWAAQLEPIFQTLMTTKEPLLNQEVSGETYPSGVYRYGLVNYYPVSLPDGKLLGVGVSGVDITPFKQAEKQLRYIAEVSSLLSTSLDYEETLQQIAKISVPQIADWCSVEILTEDGLIRRLPIAHADPAKAEIAQKLQQYVPDPQGTHPIARVLQTGQPELITEIPDSLLVEITQNEEHLEIVRQMGVKSAIIVPLVAHKQILGCITFAIAHSNRCYDQSDLGLATDIAYRAALAVENAQLYQDNHQALIKYAESLSLLDALLAGAPVAVCFLDRELRYLRINQVLADINGLPIEAHLGRKFADVFPGMASQFETQLQQVLETGEPLLNVEISNEALGRTGTYGYWLGNYYPVRNELDETVGIGIILSDVTATKLTEIALRESEARFRAMFNQAAVGIALVALNGQFLQVNPALCDITGYSKEELMQLNFQEITYPDDLAADWEQARRVLAKEISGYSLEKRYIRKDGSIIWVNLTSSAVWDANGHPKYAVGIVEDISDRKQAEAAAELAASRTARLQRITAALSEAVTPQQVADVVLNQGIAALGANAGSVTLLAEQGSYLNVIQATGYPQSVLDSWKSFPVTDPVPLAEAARTGKAIFLKSQEAFAANYPNLTEVISVTGNCAFACIPLIVEKQVIGVLGLSFATAQVFPEEDKGFMLTLGQQCAQAIARAQLYEAERHARCEAETANRIKDEFLAVLSHELRTPLNPILGWAKLLRTRKNDEKTTIRALETIERNAKLQAQLIEDLLDVSRILRGKLSLHIRIVDLKTTITSALETVRLAAEAKSIQLQTVLANTNLEVMGDGDRLQQIVWNLVSNAVKFTPAEGRVEVRLEQVGCEAQIQVIDNGKGITPEFLPYVFEYFRQADGKTTRVFGGLGLGLAIVRHLVELHGGTVSADSPGDGLGATFTVRLPLHKSAESSGLSADAQIDLTNQDSLLAGVRILLVDDQADVLEFFAFALEQYGAAVTAVTSAAEALETLVQLQPDVLLSDIGMPIMDGYMLLRQIRQLPRNKGGEIPAIALTAYAGEIDYKQAMAAGFQKHIPKPVDPADLAVAIAKLISKQ